MKHFLILIFIVSINSSFAQTKDDVNERPPTFLALNAYYKPTFIINDSRTLYLSFNAGLLTLRKLTVGPVLNLSFFKDEHYGVSYSNEISIGPFARTILTNGLSPRLLNPHFVMERVI